MTAASFIVLGAETTTLWLSIEAITATQLLLVAQAKTERTMITALKELLRGVPDADESVAEDTPKS